MRAYANRITGFGRKCTRLCQNIRDASSPGAPVINAGPPGGDLRLSWSGRPQAAAPEQTAVHGETC